MAKKNKRWGAEFNKPGWIAILGQGEFPHCFGGHGWTASGPLDTSYGPPTLILTLDSSDPRLSDIGFKSGARRQLPLFSYVNGMIGEVQRYTIDHVNRNAIFTDATSLFEKPEPLDICPNPLPERAIDLRAMTKAELPTSEAAYEKACETLVGGGGWLRIGAPIWLQNPESRNSMRGNPMHYVAAVGYSVKSPSPFLDDPGLLMFGEMALYFFASDDLEEVLVSFQSS